MQLSGYSFDRLRDDREFILYRARATRIEPPTVLLFAPASTRPSPETLKKIDHEVSLKSELDSAWAVRPLALSERGEQISLVLEDPGGETLDGFISDAMEMTQFLEFAVGLATAIGSLHERKLIHKDVKPTNVLVNSATGQVRLMGFGIASRLRREHQAPEPPEFIAGTLPYMAPEQTGRMNRSINSRSDLYALGVTLYEMLTGNLPFTASDPLEWVHCHVARHRSWTGNYSFYRRIAWWPYLGHRELRTRGNVSLYVARKGGSRPMISVDSPIVIIVIDDTRLRAAIQRLKTVGSHGASFTAQQDFCHTN